MFKKENRESATTPNSRNLNNQRQRLRNGFFIGDYKRNANSNQYPNYLSEYREFPSIARKAREAK